MHKFIQVVKINIVKTLLVWMVFAFYKELILKHVKDLIHVHQQQNKVHVYSINFHVRGLLKISKILIQQQVHVHNYHVHHLQIHKHVYSISQVYYQQHQYHVCGIQKHQHV